MKTQTFSAEHPSVDQLREIITATTLMRTSVDELITMLHDSNAIYVNGHWELLSGNHTDVFFQFSKLAQYPKFIAKISQEMVLWLRDNISESINVTLSPVAAGRFLAFSVAAALNGQMNTRVANAATDSLGRTSSTLKEGYEIRPGENVLIVNDLITTGDGVNKLLSLVRSHQANPLGVCVFADRNLEAVKTIQSETGLKVFSMVNISARHWPKQECPLCHDGLQYRQSYQYHI